jgi:hypothetical protein
MNFMMEYEKLLNLPKQTIDKNKSFITKLKKKKANHIDTIFQEKHEEVFEVIDCLKCGNCCKTTSPVFRDVDIKRISKKQKIKSYKFIETYLRTDSDGDYVLKSSPCPFLNKVDNSCTIYDYRPLACESYPHTNRKNMYQILDLTLKNTEVCPAAAKIITELQKENNMDKPGPRTNN